MDTTRPRIPLHDPLLVAIWPGMGSVAAVAGSYLIEELQPEAVGSIPEREFFSVNHVDVHNGIARTGTLPCSMFFLWRDPQKRHDLVIFVGEAQPPAERGYALCHKVLDFAEQHGVQRVVTFAAMGTQLHPQATPRVFGAVTLPEMLAQIREAGVRPLQEGRVGGLNGALLAAAAERGLEAMCLLGEMPFYAAGVVNPRSSEAVLSAFRTIAGLELDLARLHGLAEQVEPQLLSLYEQVRAQAGQLAEQGLAIFEGAEDAEEADDDEEDSDEQVEVEAPQGPESPSLDVVTRRHLEDLFDEAGRNRDRAADLKQELDRLGVFEQYEDRFLDLFRKAG